MPRPPRLNVAGIPQHVTQRGVNRQPCFFRDQHYRLYLQLLEGACSAHQCEVHAYVLMTNHVHLLITPSMPDGVSLVMRDIGRDYVRIVNKDIGRTGTMWEGRFRSSLVEDDAYSLACYRYIEMNPIRAGMVSHPEDYEWSSFAANALGRPDPIVRPNPSYLALSQHAGCRAENYRRLFDTGLSSDQVSTIRHCLKKGVPTGGSAFVRNLEQSLSVTISNRAMGRPRKRSAE